MDFILSNWEWFLLGFIIAEKIVKLTPFEWDDILVDGIKAGLKKFVGLGGSTEAPGTGAPNES